MARFVGTPRPRGRRDHPRLRNFHFTAEREPRGVLRSLRGSRALSVLIVVLTALPAAALVTLGGTAAGAPVTPDEAAGLVAMRVLAVAAGAVAAGLLMLRELGLEDRPRRVVDDELTAILDESARETDRRLLRLAGLTLAALTVLRLALELGWPPAAIPLPGVAGIATIAFGRRLALLHGWTLVFGAALASARFAPGVGVEAATPLFDPLLLTAHGAGVTAMVLLCERIEHRGALLRAGILTGLVMLLTLLLAPLVLRPDFYPRTLERVRLAQAERDAAAAALASAPAASSAGEAAEEPAAVRPREALEAAWRNAVRKVWAEYLRVFRGPFWGLVASVFAGFVLFEILPAIESGFGVLTRLHLLELADLNSPLLRRLNLEAPGTWHHSQMVARLGEAAAESIGADGLLVRVGAYYHDIGKMAKPRYFTENNPNSTANHALLKPTLSALVIHAHVKDGIELGRSLGLPEPIIAFIPEHHGTTACEFFYRQAVDLSREAGRPAPDRELFRYPGPRPRSRETGIVLIADSIEAAARSLDGPSPARLRSLVHEIIIDKLLDRQFDDCPLTLAELARVEDSLVEQLTWIHHARIKYPAKVRSAGQQRLKDLDRARRTEQDEEPGDG